MCTQRPRGPCTDEGRGERAVICCARRHCDAEGRLRTKPGAAGRLQLQRPERNAVCFHPPSEAAQLQSIAPLKVTLRWGDRRAAILTWRLRKKALLDSVYRDTISDHLLCYFEENEGSAANKGVEWDAMKEVMRGHFIKTSWEERASLLWSVLALEACLRVGGGNGG
ncbi:hypothetical protein NDU88_002404 [Pleurodeles waltl]|uniref:Uncharacterized protein n=1 Tax=Pleurodeles waltl TaxID=8319 RepID=A0AAV7KS25_PLEWA|nr:hypothetical protein NDU88_002404 [Pleurodeles waltl]